MVSNIKRGLFLCSISLVLTALLCAPVKAEEAVTIEGRLSFLDHGAEQWLVLLARDGQSYKVTGRQEARLRKVPVSLGQNNMVTVKGLRGNKSFSPCSVSRDVVTGDKGNKILKTDIRCISYFTLEATRIIAQGVSDTTLPEPLRDRQQEKIFAAAVAEQKPLAAIVGEISGTVIAAHPRKPVKSIDVRSRDKTRIVTILIGPETRITKIIPGSEPVIQKAEQLKEGQEVTVVYKRQELKAEATYITITKE